MNSYRISNQKSIVSMAIMALLSSMLYIVSIDVAEAIPAFARKYQANCSLCHTSKPRLAPFGQQFLENGYQFPGTEDGASTAKIVLDGEQGPVTLDNLSNMMAIRIRADVQTASFKTVTDDMRDEGVDTRVSVEVPKIVNIFFAGTATKNLSYFLEAEYNTMESDEPALAFERSFLQFSNLGSKQGTANLKIGRFDPSSLYSFPTHRQHLNPILPIAETNKFPPGINRIPLLPLAFSSKFFGLSTGSQAAGTALYDTNSGEAADLGEGFAILPFQPFLYNAPAQTGLSLHGRPMGSFSPLLYQIGIAFNDKAGTTGEQRTDAYAMLRYDFQAGGANVQVSGFYYIAPDAARATLVNLNPTGATGMAGMAAMNDSTDNTIMYATNTTDIRRVGIAARAQWGEFDIYGTYITDTIDTPVWTSAVAQTSKWKNDGKGLSLEMDWRFDPKWMFAVRYDLMNSAGLQTLPTMATATGSVNDDITQTVTFLSPILKYYPSPNIALYGRLHLNLSKDAKLPDTNGRIDGFSGQDHPASNLENMLTFGVDMAF